MAKPLDAKTLDGINKASQVLEEAILQLVKDDALARKAWFKFTDDTTLTDGTEGIAELAFIAGYMTAMQHVGGLVDTMQSYSAAPASST